MPFYLLEYELDPGYPRRRGEFRTEHLRLAEASAERGELLMAGPLTPAMDRALLVWSGPDARAAEAFAGRDPYVANGLVLRWRVSEWAVAVSSSRVLR